MPTALPSELPAELREAPPLSWHVYVVRCADDTYYTGIATDVTRRMAEHNDAGSRLGARYTRARRPVVLVYQERATSRSEAGKREYQIKQLARHEKQALIVAVRD